MRNKCSICGDMLVDAVGNIKSKILLLGSYPDYEDVQSGRCLTSENKNILRNELVRVGVQLSSVRYTNIWQHARKKECDIAWHIDKAIKEINGKQFVFVMGSDASKALFDLNAMDICGIKMKHKVFPKVIFYVAPNIATLYRSDIGEFRMSLKRFASEISK